MAFYPELMSYMAKTKKNSFVILKELLKNGQGVQTKLSTFCLLDMICNSILGEVK